MLFHGRVPADTEPVEPSTAPAAHTSKQELAEVQAEPVEPQPIVLALASGKAFLVQSYNADGRSAKITEIKGETLVLHMTQMDLARSKELTEKPHAQIAKQPEVETTK